MPAPGRCSDVPVEVRQKAVQALGRMCRKLNFSEYASRIIHPLVRVLECMSHRLA
jgi:FKBP12-rapamycin complex-associated protein